MGTNDQEEGIGYPGGYTDNLEVRLDDDTGAHGLFTRRDLSKGSTVTPFTAGSVLSDPTYLTVQTGPHRHITLQPDMLQYTNHSCDPNVFFNTDEMRLEALRDIRAGEELRYFYPATEWEMDRPFTCRCGAPGCLGLISGAAALDEALVPRYRFTSFIEGMLRERGKRKGDGAGGS